VESGASRPKTRGERRIEAEDAWRTPNESTYELAMRFFNDRDVNISLWDAEVELYRGADFIGTFIPTIRRWVVDGRGDELGPIDLESRKSVYLVVEVDAGCQEREEARSADRVEFVATKIPGGKKVREPLPLWADA
jgi:hypothetical protein